MNDEQYTELLQDIKAEQIRTNEIFSGQLFFSGIIGGLILGLILWERFIKL